MLKNILSFCCLLMLAIDLLADFEISAYKFIESVNTDTVSIKSDHNFENLKVHKQRHKDRIIVEFDKIKDLKDGDYKIENSAVIKAVVKTTKKKQRIRFEFSKQLEYLESSPKKIDLSFKILNTKFELKKINFSEQGLSFDFNQEPEFKLNKFKDRVYLLEIDQTAKPVDSLLLPYFAPENTKGLVFVKPQYLDGILKVYIGVENTIVIEARRMSNSIKISIKE